VAITAVKVVAVVEGAATPIKRRNSEECVRISSATRLLLSFA
jgi:hypothetical protein